MAHRGLYCSLLLAVLLASAPADLALAKNSKPRQRICLPHRSEFKLARTVKLEASRTRSSTQKALNAVAHAVARQERYVNSYAGRVQSRTEFYRPVQEHFEALQEELLLFSDTNTRAQAINHYVARRVAATLSAKAGTLAAAASAHVIVCGADSVCSSDQSVRDLLRQGLMLAMRRSTLEGLVQTSSEGELADLQIELDLLNAQIDEFLRQASLPLQQSGTQVLLCLLHEQCSVNSNVRFLQLESIDQEQYLSLSDDAKFVHAENWLSRRGAVEAERLAERVAKNNLKLAELLRTLSDAEALLSSLRVDLSAADQAHQGSQQAYNEALARYQAAQQKVNRCARKLRKRN